MKEHQTCIEVSEVSGKDTHIQNLQTPILEYSFSLKVFAASALRNET